MTVWLLIVDCVRALVFSAAHVCGNSLGAGVLAVSVVVRIALLPMTLRVARAMMAHQARLAALEPQLAKIRRRYAGDPARLAEATMEVHRRNGISLVPPGMFGSTLIQLPLGAALYQALAKGVGSRARFIWIANLAQPDALLAAIGAVLAGAAIASGPGPANRAGMILSVGLTFALAWRLSASVGLYLVASNGVGVAQSLILRRTTKPPQR